VGDTKTLKVELLESDRRVILSALRRQQKHYLASETMRASEKAISIAELARVAKKIGAEL
jgi:hypothetical protein